jgi:hypothetical protein
VTPAISSKNDVTFFIYCNCKLPPQKTSKRYEKIISEKHQFC